MNEYPYIPLKATTLIRKDVQKLINACELLGWTIRGSNSSRSKIFVPSSDHPYRSEAHPISCSMGTGILSLA